MADLALIILSAVTLAGWVALPALFAALDDQQEEPTDG